MEETGLPLTHSKNGQVFQHQELRPRDSCFETECTDKEPHTVKLEDHKSSIICSRTPKYPVSATFRSPAEAVKTERREQRFINTKKFHLFRGDPNVFLRTPNDVSPQSDYLLPGRKRKSKTEEFVSFL